MNKNSSPIRSIVVGLVTLLVLIVLAYGFSVTNINFEETRFAHTNSAGPGASQNFRL